MCVSMYVCVFNSHQLLKATWSTVHVGRKFLVAHTCDIQFGSPAEHGRLVVEDVGE